MIKVECVIVKFNLTLGNMPKILDFITIFIESAVESGNSNIPG